MPADRIYEDFSVVVRRANTVFRILAVLAFLVLAYFWKLQILDFQKYWDLAEANKTRTRVLSAPRGLILDRRGDILADNKASFKVSLIRENITGDPESCYASISGLLDINLDDLRSRIDKYRSLPAFEPIVIKDGLASEEIAPIESRRLEHPELVVEAEPKRSYPFGTLAAHVLGYLQERTPEEINADPARSLGLGDMGGRAGVERQYDELLTGQDGKVVEIVDSVGRTRSESARQHPTQGNEIKLSLDRRIQERAQSLLGEREGAVVVLSPRTGEILAMVSFPTFDPNRFISRFTPEEWLALANEANSPLENRAVRGLYAPGSIFKPVMALGGLEFGFVTPQTRVYCTGSTEIYGSRFGCWFAPGHGSMNLANAIRNSCNIYFYDLGRRMGIDTIARAAERMGLGRKTGVDIPGEKDGLVPTAEWKKKTTGRPWYPGETISVSIGQGQLLVTPLQLAALMARIANRGGAVTPHLLLGRGNPPPLEPAPFKPETFESVIEGMWRSVNADGTGMGAFVEGMDICGKTGSTQTIGRATAERMARAGREVKSHSWFSGFAPRTSPRYVVTVLVEYGGGGGATAAPLAGRIFKFLKELDER
jgi:penicillin-binding protein 2